MRDLPTGPEALDLRLALPAGVAWLVAWQGRVLPVGAVLSLSVVAAAGAFVVLAGRSVVGRHPSRDRSARALVLAGCLACAAAAGVATSARVHTRTTGPLAVAARGGSAVVVDAVLVDDPRLVPPRGAVLAFRQLVAARVRVERLEVAGRRVRLREPVLVLTSDGAWLGLLPSTRVRVEGRLQAPAAGDDVAALLSARGPPVVLRRASAVQRAAGRLRQGLRDAAATLPADESGLLPGLVDGDTAKLDPALQQAFRVTGLTHLVAVSGTNVAVVLSCALLLCGRFGVALRWRPPVAAVLLLAFVVLARPSPSVLRAAVMGLVALLALATGSRRQALPALSAAVLVLVLLSPELASQPGFALSTLATAGLLVLAPTWRARLATRMPGWAADALAVPAAAQVACGPVVVALSGQVGLLAVPANLLAVPAVAPATVLGVLAALVAPVWLPAGRALAWLAWLPTHWLVLIARTGQRQPGAQLLLPTGWAGAGLMLGLTGVVLLVLHRPRLRRVAAAATAGVLMTAAVLVLTRPPWPPPGWVMVTCDVGQGDSHVVRLGHGTALVVDTGPDPVAEERCLSRLGVRRVSLLVLTHLHADHVEGVPGLLRHRRVAQVEIGPLDQPATERARLLDWVRGTPVVRAQIGEVRQAAGVRWEVLDATARHGTDSDPNNSSIVLRLVTHGVSVLFAGDLEADAQRSLMERGLDLHATVLKVPHHGSAKQDPAFLDAVRARIALTPVGAGNPYGHPSPVTLKRLERDGARTYRSDRDGDVAVVVRDGRVSSRGRGGEGTAGTTRLSAVTDHPHVVPAVRRPGAGPPLDLPGLTLCDAVIPAAGSTGSARGPPRPWDDAPVPESLLLSPLTLVVGDEELLVSRAVSAVVRAARARTPDVEVRDLEGATLVPGDLDEVLSPSLFGDERVVVVRAAHDLSKEAAAEVVAYLADPLPEVQLLLVHAGGTKGKQLLPPLVAAGARRVDCPKITKASERRDLVRRELRSDGRQVEEDAVTILIDAVGTDLRELCSAASQLLSDTEGPVTAEVVARYHRGRAEASGFAVADRAVDGDLAGALELARWGVSAGLAPVLVTSALASTLRAVAMVASAGRQSVGALAAQLGMPPWKVEKTQRQARGWRPDSIAAALQAVAQADGDVKGGAVDAGYAVERALLTVVRARNEAR